MEAGADGQAAAGEEALPLAEGNGEEDRIRPRLADGSVDEEYDGDGAGKEILGNQNRSKAQHAYKLQIRVESSGEGGFQREADRGCEDLRREAVSDQDAS